jgi:DNA primase
MGGRIPSAFIDELLARIDIVDVIQERIALKKAGRDWSARCPFHDERSPSFTVSPTKQFFHCFGCGAHGSAIKFVMDYDRLEFPDAVEDLASRIGLKVPYENARRTEPAPDTTDLYALLDQAAKYFQRELANSEVATAYFDGRGVDASTRAAFALGYAPDQWDGLRKALGGSPQRVALLEKAGMLIAGDRGAPYDRFRDRVMFPILDRRGRVIAFGGRVMGKADGPKYLNSPETPLFQKGRELFGLWQVRQAQTKLTRLIVVEGYMDVIALHQHGVPQAVATLGTATTREHAELLFRSCQDVYFCFDGDRAGRQAAWRAVESALPRMRDGRQAMFLFLPEGEDPDSLIRREGAAGFEQWLREATPLSEFFFAHQELDTNLASADGRARLEHRCKELLQGIPDGAFRDRMQEMLIEKTRILWPALRNTDTAWRGAARELLDDQLAAARGERPAGATAVSSDMAATAPAMAAQGPGRSVVRHAITLLVQHPTFAHAIEPPHVFSALRQPGVALLIELIETSRRRPELSTGALLESFNERPEAGALRKLAVVDLPGEIDSLREEFLDALHALDRQTQQQRIDDLLARQNTHGLGDGEKSELRELLRGKDGAAQRPGPA